MLVAVAIYFLLAFAVQLADGGGRRIANTIALLYIPGSIGFFVARALWRWWRTQPHGTAGVGALAALGMSVIGWANVALATAVRGINEGNYALIIIAPLAMMVGLLVSLGNLFAAGLGVASSVTALQSQGRRSGWIVAAGFASVVLNLTAIYRTFRIYENP